MIQIKAELESRWTSTLTPASSRHPAQKFVSRHELGTMTKTVKHKAIPEPYSHEPTSQSKGCYHLTGNI